MVSPIDVQEIRFITPLGNLNPPGHTVPSDHIYFYFVNPDSCPCDVARPRLVVAPAPGVVQYIIAGQDDKIGVQMNEKLSYYLDHVKLLPEIHPGQQIAAGQSLGTTSGLSFAIDVGISDLNITLTGFVNPARYYDTMLHAVGALKCYDEPLRAQLYSFVHRSGTDKDGKIDFDQAGKLVGNWFLLGLPLDKSMSAEGWPKQLAFVYDMYEPTAARISIGGTLSMTGVYAIGISEPDPSTISTASGLQKYTLYDRQRTFPLGTMYVRMLADDQIKVETFQATPPVSFTASAVTYTR